MELEKKNNSWVQQSLPKGKKELITGGGCWERGGKIWTTHSIVIFLAPQALGKVGKKARGPRVDCGFVRWEHLSLGR